MATIEGAEVETRLDRVMEEIWVWSLVPAFIVMMILVHLMGQQGDSFSPWWWLLLGPCALRCMAVKVGFMPALLLALIAYGVGHG